jgi:hypothetical protein
MYLHVDSRSIFIPLNASSIDITRAVRSVVALMFGVIVNNHLAAYVAALTDPRR